MLLQCSFIVGSNISSAFELKRFEFILLKKLRALMNVSDLENIYNNDGGDLYVEQMPSMIKWINVTVTKNIITVSGINISVFIII